MGEILVPALIERKRNGQALSSEEWSRLVAGFTAGTVPDYQMAALLMAVMFNGMEGPELAALTDAMLDSGVRLERGERGRPCVGMHSTGGVGDKVSLILVPLVASCGVAVPMMAGRGSGHTGGTLDKLEAIAGVRTDLSPVEARRQVSRIGCAIFGATPEIAPADRKLYALRDATGTVESIPLIAASIMAKKLAENLDALVLDVTCGSGAFLPQRERALELAQTMIRLGADHGCPAVALITAMDRPLGRACGNALETEEALLALRGEAPTDLLEVTYALGAEMLVAAGVAPDAAAARPMLEAQLGSGRAAECCAALIEAQGGNPRVLDDPGVLPQAPRGAVYPAPADGHIRQIEPRRIGRAITALGGGRRRMGERIDPAVGFVISVKPGARVRRGDPIATIHARDDEGLILGRAALEAAIEITDDRFPPTLPLISHRVTRQGVEVLA